VAEHNIDARGLACPEPVVLARKAMLTPGCQRVLVRVNDEAAIENIQRMATTQGWLVQIDRQAGETVLVLQSSTASATAALPEAPPKPLASGLAVLVASDAVGAGDDQLGRLLMRAFIKTLGELDPLPEVVLFMNAGVRLTTEQPTVIDDLRKLEARGVRVFSCGTCLDYYHLLDALQVGAKSNMFEIVSLMAGATKVLRP